MTADALDASAIDRLRDMLGDAESVTEMIDALVEEVPARLAARAGADAGDAALPIRPAELAAALERAAQPLTRARPL